MVEISVIIATYNRGEQLLRTLQSLTTQSLDRELWELVVVDNNSKDNTQELFKQFLKEHPKVKNMRIVFEGSQGLSHARNRGIRESTGKYIAFMDDDEEANPEFVESYLNFFKTHPEAAAAGGEMIALYEYETPKWLSPYVEQALSSTIDLGDRVKPLKKGRYPIGGNMAFRRSSFEKYGVFNPDLGRTGEKLLGGEEKDLFNRVREGGGEIYWTPDPKILHIIPESRLTKGHLVELSKMIGQSEQVRTRSLSRWRYLGRLFSELIKWAGTLLISLGYILTGRASMAQYLCIMRWNVTKGLVGRVK